MSIESILLKLLLINKPQIWFSILTFFGIIRLLPKQSSIAELVKNYYVSIELIMLVSFVMLIPHIWNCIQKQYERHMIKRKAIKDLYYMSEYEKDILKDAYDKKTKTIYRSFDEAGIIALLNKNIIHFAGQSNLIKQTYIIPDYIWHVLKIKHDQILN